MRTRARVLVLLAPLLGAVLAACHPVPSISIMTYNVQNLFDTSDDPRVRDETFLPAARKTSDVHRARCARIEVERWRTQCLEWNWDEATLEEKMQRLARVILQSDGGRGPDILVLQEVENRDVLERLRRGYLAPAAYREAILIDGGDARGIDVAFLSRLQTTGPARLHEIDFGPGAPRDRRGILEARFRLPDGSALTGYAVHFPAPFHPRAERERAFAALNALVDGEPQAGYAFAAGDFNIPGREARESDMIGRHTRGRWVVAHLCACRGCRGTHYYPPQSEWSFLDMILLSPALAPDRQHGWRLRPEGTGTPDTAPGQLRRDGTPAGFVPGRGTGVSDHLPLRIELGRSRRGRWDVVSSAGDGPPLQCGGLPAGAGL